MRRRSFVGLLGFASAWPLAVYGQNAKPVIGFLNAGSPQQLSNFAAAFVQGLKETGYIAGENVTIDYRWAGGVNADLPKLAAGLVADRVDVIAVFGTPSARIAKAAIAGTAIPMVFANGSDPVADGLVASLNRPGGRVTGVTSIAASIVPKRLELLRDLVPGLATVGVLINPNNPLSIDERESTEAAARNLGQQVEVFTASTSGEVEAVFRPFASRRPDGLIVTTDLFLFGHIKRLAELAIEHRLPAIAPLKEFAAAGGLISYGASIPDAYRQAGVYCGRVLKGENPVNLPILQPTKFDYVINLKTAKILDLSISPLALARADEVIE